MEEFKLAEQNLHLPLSSMTNYRAIVCGLVENLFMRSTFIKTCSPKILVKP